MQGNPLFGKFGPIILLGVLQLILILAVPSTAPNQSNSAFGAGYNGDGAAGANSGGSGTTGGVSSVTWAPGAAVGGGRQ